MAHPEGRVSRPDQKGSCWKGETSSVVLGRDKKPVLGLPPVAREFAFRMATTHGHGCKCRLTVVSHDPFSPHTTIGVQTPDMDGSRIQGWLTAGEILALKPRSSHEKGSGTGNPRALPRWREPRRLIRKSENQPPGGGSPSVCAATTPACRASASTPPSR